MDGQTDGWMDTMQRHSCAYAMHSIMWKNDVSGILENITEQNINAAMIQTVTYQLVFWQSLGR